jgi:uncharacterized protein YyaL (SSP411 family)
MPNRLADETSPYLLQHADNPVQWQPWGEQALAQARALNRPILLSIGYSACHWCHVMAHECFEDEAVAAVMNERFINIKVDREERPDLDQIYQTAHQMLASRPGGWPLTVFMTPDGAPFYAGTYFPKQPSRGLPGFADLCERIAELYQNRRTDIALQNRQLLDVLATLQPTATTTAPLDAAAIASHRDMLLGSLDEQFGGFGGAPKFPHPTDLAFLLPLDDQARQGALLTLRRMAEGGLYDQLAGGFFRYCVDAAWQIPHFEKMLYDNALLLPVYADAWRHTGEPLFARVVEQTIDWALGEMQLPEGGFASSLDADSEGEEGRFYLWQAADVHTLLGADEWRVASRHWGLADGANFEHSAWHLRVAAPLAVEDATALAAAREKLLAARQTRTRPGRDDKVLTGWNALMIEGLARAGQVFGRSDWLAAARRALAFLTAELWRSDRLLATWRGGRAHLSAYLDDYAFLLAAVNALMAADFRDQEADLARRLADSLLRHFEDHDKGGFYFTADDHEQLIHRPKPAHDNATPAGNAVAARALLALGARFGNAAYAAAARRTLALFAPERHATAGMAGMLLALGDALAEPNAPHCTAAGCAEPPSVFDAAAPPV